MLQTNIDYKVKDHQNYKQVTMYGSKPISKINEKSGNFMFELAMQDYQIQLIFKAPAIISSVEFNAKFVNQISFDFYAGQEKSCTLSYIVPYQFIKVAQTKLIKLQEKSSKFDRVKVRFLNHDAAKQTCINHIFFKGFSQDSGKKGNKVKNVTKDDFIEIPSKKKADEQKKIFNTRNKQRAATPKQDLLRQVQMGGKHQTRQQADLRKAIQMSKKQQKSASKKKHQQGDLQKQIKRIKQEEQREKNDVVIIDQKEQANQFFDYELEQYQKIKKVFEHVTPQWIQAQRKAQKQKSIQQRHSLASRIKIRVFKQMSFCINSIVGKEKANLIELIKQLGGRIIEEPANDCVVITNRMEGGKINFAKQLSRIKFAKPEYIYDCDKTKAKLDFKGYSA